MKMIPIIKWHRRLALWTAVALVIWAASGLLHPVMTWTSPRPVTFAPPQAQGLVKITQNELQSALRKNDVTEISHLRITPNTIMADDKVIDRNAKKITPDGMREHAVAIARHYTAEISEVKSADIITEFSSSYPYVNRYLPAWRIAFADGKTVYVDAYNDRLASITTPLKVALQWTFENLHTFKFLDGLEGLRLAIILLLVGSVPAMALMGIALRIGVPRPNGTTGSRKSHRVLTMVIVVPLLCFSLSGLFHLVMNTPLVYTQPHETAQKIAVADIRFTPKGDIMDMSLVTDPEGTPWWRIKNDVGITFKNAKTGDVMMDEAFALHLAGLWERDETISSITTIATFTDEYGFANKRLPVWRVDFVNADAPVLFIETRTATLAAQIAPIRAAETWSFSTLHKWQFIDNRVARDGLMILAVFLALGAVLAGLRLRR